MSDTDGLNERVKIQKDILWGLYQEHRTHARHSETLRATILNMLIVASAVLVSIVTYDKDITLADLGAALLLVCFGVLGLAFTIYYTAKIYYHKQTAVVYRKHFNTQFFNLTTENSLDDLDNQADQAYRDGLAGKLWQKTRLVKAVRRLSNSLVLWSILPLLIALIGVYLLFATML